MNSLEVQYSKLAVKAINAMDRPTKQRIKQGIEGLTIKPPQGDIKTMQGFTDGRQRLRIGKYRIIYKYTLDTSIEILYIIDIGSRGDIYK
ncbi:MAG: type II toxin-antitoxin system RelE/ParE family toxin [Oscillospiraceae bacterium]